jgi:NAD(P)-dependent dehydrogenase (short-subunit alcohol dehydrogenase family)
MTSDERLTDERPTDEPLTIAIIGISGAIGSALADRYRDQGAHVIGFSRSPADANQWQHLDYADESTIAAAAASAGSLDRIIVATGLLHSEALSPEKALKHLSTEALTTSFLTNCVGPALVAKHFLPCLRKDRPGVFAALSARVSSISDNRLGGWHSYRASKAALNMIIRGAAIETARTHKKAAVVGLHPGTVDSALSKPFQARVPEGKLFSPEFSAEALINVVENLQAKDTGKLFAWDGQEILP